MKGTTYIWAEGGKFRLYVKLKVTRYCVVIREDLGTNKKYYTLRKEGNYATKEEAVSGLKKMAEKRGLKVFSQLSYHSIGSEKFDREKLIEYFPKLVITSDTEINTQYNYIDIEGVRSVLIYHEELGNWDILSKIGKSFFCIPPTTFRDFANDLERCGVHIEQKHEEPVEEIVTL